MPLTERKGLCCSGGIRQLEVEQQALRTVAARGCCGVTTLACCRITSSCCGTRNRA
jgi:hypothetical protein